MLLINLLGYGALAYLCGDILLKNHLLPSRKVSYLVLLASALMSAIGYSLRIAGIPSEEVAGLFTFRGTLMLAGVISLLNAYRIRNHSRKVKRYGSNRN